MAVQAQLGGLAGCLLPYGGGLAEEQLQAGGLLSAAAGNKSATHQYNYCAAGGVASAAQSELTCHGGGFGGAVASRKRGRDSELEPLQYAPPSSSAALLPIPGVVVHKPAAPATASNASRMEESAAASTSGRPVTADGAGALAAELLWQQGAEVDALVRAECERLRAGLERARKRQGEALARAAAAGAARALREKEAELDAARRRAAELEERLRQAAAETQAWCGLARSNEAVASGLRATLDAVLLRAGAGAGPAPKEGFGDSGGADDAQSCCYVEAAAAVDTAAATSPAGDGKWACKACGWAEASVLLLPCRHLCLCKACEPRTDACPVCLADKNASIHVEPN